METVTVRFIIKYLYVNNFKVAAPSCWRKYVKRLIAFHHLWQTLYKTETCKSEYRRRCHHGIYGGTVCDKAFSPNSTPKPRMTFFLVYANSRASQNQLNLLYRILHDRSPPYSLKPGVPLDGHVYDLYG